MKTKKENFSRDQAYKGRPAEEYVLANYNRILSPEIMYVEDCAHTHIEGRDMTAYYFDGTKKTFEVKADCGAGFLRYDGNLLLELQNERDHDKPGWWPQLCQIHAADELVWMLYKDAGEYCPVKNPYAAIAVPFDELYAAVGDAEDFEKGKGGVLAKVNLFDHILPHCPGTRITIIKPTIAQAKRKQEETLQRLIAAAR